MKGDEARARKYCDADDRERNFRVHSLGWSVGSTTPPSVIVIKVYMSVSPYLTVRVHLSDNRRSDDDDFLARLYLHRKEPQDVFF